MRPEPQIRPAKPDDALALAKLIDIAGEGIPAWLWARQAAEGQSPLDIGRARAGRDAGGFSYTNASIAEVTGSPRGMVLSYAIDTAPEGDPDGLPAAIAPFVELEKHAVSTWYINALAVFPGYRDRGIGRRLLTHAESRARAAGLSRMSIQVFAQNSPALRLYRRLGYQETARAQVRDHPCQPYYTGDVILAIKPLAE